MENRESLERALTRARRALSILQEEVAGFGSLHVPVDVRIEFEDKQREVADLESRLGQLSGQPAKAVPDNLLRQDIFVGRRDEIARCLAALDPEDRSWGVVIDGIGGMGKTSLALEVAQQARKSAMFAAYLFVSAKTNRMTIEGVREETLAFTSLDGFVGEFARLLGEQEIARMTDATGRRQALLDALRGRRVLLVWDNLETLTAEERKQIGDFLLKLSAPNKAIVTSRYRAGESGVPIRLDKLTEEDAFDLMTALGKRHQRIAGELRYAGDAARRSLYQAAGGSPLVMNLALGFIGYKGWSFGQVLNYVRDPARSKDLYGFLFTDALQDISESEGAVLSALAAMQTPADLSFLLEVSRRTEREVETALDWLVTLSLVNDLDGGRFILLPLTRAYLQSALAARRNAGPAVPGTSKLDPAIQRNVLQYWLNYAQQYSEGGNPEQYQRLEAAWPNLEATASTLYQLADLPALRKQQETPAAHETKALRAAKDAARLLVDLANALTNFWNWGYWDELRLLQQWAYETALALGDWNAAGWRAYLVAWVYYLRSDGNEAGRWAELMGTAMEQAGNRTGQASATRMRGNAAELAGNLAEAKQLYLKALAVCRDMNMETSEANLLSDLGDIARRIKNYQDAESYYQQALAIYEKPADKSKQATVLNNMGLLALDQGQPEAARSWHERGLVLAQETGRQDEIALAQHGLALVLEQESRYAEALERAEQALAIHERLRDSNLENTRELVVRLRQKVQEAKQGK